MKRVALAFLLGQAAAKAHKCLDLTVPVTISAHNARFDLEAPRTNVQVTELMLNLAKAGSNYTEELLKGYHTVSGTFNISATYCQPGGGCGQGAPSTIQVLTHGIGFDKSYWDFPAKQHNYSYVKQALSQGYATFAFDRLGVGKSSHDEPINIIQAALEVEALNALSQQLRAKAIPGIDVAFDKMIHVGHSFGSIQTMALTAKYPHASDAIVLTGFAGEGAFVPYFLLGGNFVMASNHSGYRHGYLAAGNPSAVQTNFFANGQFDPEILAAAAAGAQPVTIGELLTLAGTAPSSSDFDGPVLMVTGDRDLPFCGANCSGSVLERSRSIFPKACVFDTFLVPGAGHGMNLEYSHPTTYQTINAFLDEHADGSGSKASNAVTASVVAPPEIRGRRSVLRRPLKNASRK